MTIRAKTLAVICITSAGCALTAYYAALVILNAHFAELERRDARQNIDRAMQVLTLEPQKLRSTVCDWATWDDTYDFVNDGNKVYIEKNLTRWALRNLGVDLILYIRPSGQVVYGEDLYKGRINAIPKGFPKPSFRQCSYMHCTTGCRCRTGVALLDDQPMLIASAPILNSAAKGPVRGILVMGRRLDPVWVNKQAGVPNSLLSIRKLDAQGMPPDFLAVRRVLLAGSDTQVRTLSPDRVAGYAAVRDINGRPVLILRMVLPRYISVQARNSLHDIALEGLVVALMGGIVLSLLVEKTVVNRLACLNSDVKRIGAGSDAAERVSVAGRDELSSLAREINGMLEALQAGHEKLETRVRERTSELAEANDALCAEIEEHKQAEEALARSEEATSALLRAMPDLVLRLSGDGIVLGVNKEEGGVLRILPSPVLGKALPEILPPRIAQTLIAAMAEACQTGVTQTCEYPFKTRRGIRHHEARIIPTGSDELFAIMRDITDRKRAEEALEKAYVREHHIADVLQHALMPRIDLEVVGYRIVGDYRPALNEAEVCGDFYDVFKLPDGRLALVIGDVSGKGLEAAVHTAMAKYVLRAYAHEDASPNSVLTRLNRVMCDHTPDDVFVTVFYGVLDPTTRILTFGNAGHESPLLQARDAERPVPLAVTGRAIGVAPESSYGECAVTLASGDLLLVYTDGITDARSGGRFLGLDGLTDVLAANAGGDEEFIIGAVLAAASEVAGGDLRDDAALLVVKATTC